MVEQHLSQAELHKQLAQAQAQIEQLEAQLAIQLADGEPPTHLLYNAIEHLNEALIITDASITIRYVNQAFTQITGRTKPMVIGKTPFMLLDPNVNSETLSELAGNLQQGTPFSGEMSTQHMNGTVLEVAWTTSPLRTADGSIRHYVTVLRDITAEKRNATLQQRVSQLLEAIAEEQPLSTMFDMLMRMVEEYYPATKASVLLLDAATGQLRHGAAPSLPEAYTTAIDGVKIGPNTGSCGTAAYEKRLVIVTDIENDPLWDDYRHVALPHGLRACWSKPILNPQEEVLGTFALYYDRVNTPTAEELELLNLAAHLAGLMLRHLQKHRSLRESEEKYRSLVESADASISLVDRSGRYLYLNRIAAAPFQLPPEALVGKTVYDLFSPDAAASILRDVQQVIDQNSGMVLDPEVIIAGKRCWFRTSIQPVHDSTGSSFGAFIYATEITEQKEAEAAVRASEAQLNRAQRIAHLGSWTLNLQSGETDWSEEFFRICGLEPDSCQASVELGLSLIHPEDRARAEQAMRTAQELGQPYDVEKRIVQPSGDVRWVISQGEVLLDAAQKPYLLIGTFLDITDRKRAELALKEANDRLEQRVRERTSELEQIKDRLEAIFDHSGDAIMLVNVAQGIQQANHAFEELFGIAAERYLGASLERFVHPNDSARLTAILDEVAVQHLKQQLETRAKRADGSFFDAEISIAPVNRTDKAVTSLVCIIRDVSERALAQHIVAEERNLLRTLIDLVPEYIYVKDLQHRIIVSNAAHRRSLEALQPGSPLGKTVYDLFPMDAAQAFHADDATVIQSGETILNKEESTYGQHGEPIWGLTSKIPLRNLKGDVIGLVGVTHDISILKANEAALRHSEAQLRESQQMLKAVLDTIPVRVFWKDRNSVYQGCNQRYAADAGLASTAEVIGRRDVDMPWHPEEAAIFFNDDQQVIQSGMAKLDYEEIQTLADGSQKIVRTSKLPLRNAEGTIIGVLGSYEDITERKLVEDAARRYQADLQSVIESTSTAFVLLDDRGVIRVVNDRAQDYFEGFFNIRLSIGTNMLDYIPSVGHAQYRERFNAVMRGAHLKFGINAVRDGQMRHVAFEYFPVKSAQGEILGVNIAFEDITERQQTEEKLRYLASLQAQMYDAVIGTDLDFKVQSWNKAAERMYGWTAEEAIGQLLGELLKTTFPDEQTMQESIIRLQTDGHWSGEAVHIHRDGTPVQILASVALQKDERGIPVGIVGVNRDITQHKRAEIALAQKYEDEKQMQTYLKALNEISIELTRAVTLDEFYRLTVQRGLERFNFERIELLLYDAATNNMIGTYGTDVDGQVVDEHHLRQELTDLKDIFHRTMVRQERFALNEQAALFANLQPIGTGWNAAAALWNGEVLGWLIADNALRHQPISQAQLDILSLYALTVGSLLARKRVEHKLLMTSQRLELAVKAGKIGIWDWDIIQDVLHWDERMYAIYGTSQAQFSGAVDAWQQGLHPDDAEQAQRALMDAINSRSLFDTEFRVRWKDGTIRHIQANALAIKDANGTVNRMIGVNLDITERKEALEREKELGELKSRFVSMASHEFRTPLTSIMATAETLLRYRERMSEIEITQRLEKIRDQVLFMKEMMDDVLDLARIQAGRMEFKPESADLALLCQEAIEELETYTEYDGRIQYNRTVGNPYRRFDTRLMRQAISNILSNALKYSPKDQRVTVNLVGDDTAITLTIIDQGIGIPPEDLKHLFEPFHRAKNVGTISGTGLGLSITKQAITLHDGSITVDSEVGIGTTVTCTLPLIAIPKEEHGNAENTRD